MKTTLALSIAALLLLAPLAFSQVFDENPPVTSVTLIDADGDGFITGVILTAVDGEVAVKEIHYFVNGGLEEVVAGDTVALGPFVAEPGFPETLALEYFAEDENDNTEDPQFGSWPIDACPDASAIVNGQDADADDDGCPEVETNLCEDIASSGLADGIRTSLLKKCLNAEDSYARGRNNAGNSMLDAFIAELAAQDDQAVPAALVADWTARAQDVIAEHPV